MKNDQVTTQATKPTTETVPMFVQRGLPGAFHENLKPLSGDWQVAKESYIATGSREKPATSREMTSRRRWVGGGKHLMDITEGSMGESPYYRLGILGFSNMDRRYEWSTFDGVNANRMVYQSAPCDSPSGTIVLSGVFTDQGLISEDTVGKEIAMRTLIRIQSDDLHEIELYCTPPGGSEILVERAIYSRVQD